MSLPKRNSADGRCYWMKPEVQEELQPLFDQCIQDAIDGKIMRLDSLWPPIVVSSEWPVCELLLGRLKEYVHQETEPTGGN